MMLNNTAIPVTVLRKFPPSCTILGVESVPDMFGEDRVCARVMWIEPGQGVRVAWFAVDNADYVGEY